jgi:hypothetical protein
MIIRLFVFLILLEFLASTSAYSNDYHDFLIKRNIPYWVLKTFREKRIIKNYNYHFKLNPMYLRGDFNGDDAPDIAMMVKEKLSNKLGIMVIHFGSNDTFILGAGKEFGNGGNDFKWMTNWRVMRSGKVDTGADETPPPSLKGEALFVEKAESASAIIYWDGEEYDWYQQGD